jgi:V-type H+-transporting ATPase subunit H
LEKNRKILSSFEKYVKEINTEVLDWTPCHSEKFWRENVKRFEEQDFYLVRKLVLLIDSGNDKTVAVACYDLGEFCRFHNQGRGYIIYLLLFLFLLLLL